MSRNVDIYYRFTPELLAFIERRSRPFIEPHKSLETIVAGAYLRGMCDAIDAIGFVDNKKEPA